MKKMVYVAKSARMNRDVIIDIFDDDVSFDLATARLANYSTWRSLTLTERKSRNLYIEGFLLDVEDGESAEDAYFRLVLDTCWSPDPGFFEEYMPEED